MPAFAGTASCASNMLHIMTYTKLPSLRSGFEPRHPLPTAEPNPTQGENSPPTLLPTVGKIAALFPGMGEAEFGEFRADVEANGLLSPITLWRGEIVDGRHRYRASSELGIEPRYTHLDDAWDEAQVVRHIVSLNLKRRHLSESQRAMVAAKLTTTSRDETEARQQAHREQICSLPVVSKSDAAEILTVSERSVQTARKVLDEAPELAEAIEQGDVAVSAAADVARHAPDMLPAIEAGTITPVEAVEEARERKKAHVAQSSGNNEWYTPPAYLEAARIALDGFDTDPASSETAQQFVGADKFYTEQDNGLSKDWHGSVWLNPPYAQPLIGQFIEKLAEQVALGNVTDAIVSVNNGTETAWGQRLLSLGSAVCFPKGRIKFLDHTGTPANTPLQGQMFVYVGPSTGSFAAAFDDIGVVLRAA